MVENIYVPPLDVDIVKNKKKEFQHWTELSPSTRYQSTLLHIFRDTKTKEKS